jgi:predicted hydrocarbon binding protein
VLVKGIIFNLVEEVVIDDYSVETWEDLLDLTHVSGAYSAVGSYPDEELTALVDAGSEKTGISGQDLLRHIGRRAIPMLRQRYPEFFEMHTDCRGFLGSLNEVIHPEVRKLYEGAEPPLFVLSEADDGSLLVEYHSHRSMCALAEGLIMGTADLYGEQVTVSQLACKLQGASHCELRVASR